VIAVLVLGCGWGSLAFDRQRASAAAAGPGRRTGLGASCAGPRRSARAGCKTTDDVTSLTGAESKCCSSCGAALDIEKRAADLDRREGVLKGAGRAHRRKIREIKKLQATVEQAISKYDEQETKRLDSLVKIYETMKPTEAAKIFEQMDLRPWSPWPSG